MRQRASDERLRTAAVSQAAAGAQWPASDLARYSVWCGFFLLNIPAIIFGHLARRRSDPGDERTRRLARCGLFLGYSHLGAVIFVLFQLVMNGSLPFASAP